MATGDIQWMNCIYIYHIHPFYTFIQGFCTCNSFYHTLFIHRIPYSLFSKQTFWHVTVGGAQVLPTTLTMALFRSIVPVRHDLAMASHCTLKQLNGIQPLFILSFTPLPFLLWHVKMSAVEKGISSLVFGFSKKKKRSSCRNYPSQCSHCTVVRT